MIPENTYHFLHMFVKGVCRILTVNIYERAAGDLIIIEQMGMYVMYPLQIQGQTTPLPNPSVSAWRDFSFDFKNRTPSQDEGWPGRRLQEKP